MPRIFTESRWLQKFSDLELKAQVLSVCRDVWKQREVIPYPDVIRARILMLALEPEVGTAAKAISFAKAMEVERTCVWNYFTRDVKGWADRMEQRLGRKAELRTATPKRMRLTQDDLKWIAKFLKTCTVRSWRDKLGALRGAAYHDPNFKHLSRLPRSTLWDNRKQLEVMDQCVTQEREKCIRKRPRTSSKAKERDSMIFPPKQEDIEPDAVVVPFGNRSTDDTGDPVEGVSKWTGNPF